MRNDKLVWIGCLCGWVFLLAACTRAIDDGLEESETGHTVQVLTRAETDVVYPLCLYAFDCETGEMVRQTKIQSAGEDIRIGLAEGKYRLVALGGAEECILPSAPVLEDVIAMPEGHLMQTPLQMGSAEVYVTQSTTVNMVLAYQVAAVELEIVQVPADVVAVSVTLSPLYDGLTLSGQYTGNSSVTVNLVEETEGVWNTSVFYTFPGASKQLGLSISLISPEGEEVYGYTCDKTLEVATPYLLSGSYMGGFVVSGNFTVVGWNEPQTFNFFFGGGGDTGGTESEDAVEGEDEETVSPGTFWNGHFIGAVDNVTESSADLLLLSRDEWRNVPSANNIEQPRLAQTLLDGYEEGEMSEWTIPTVDEAKAIRAAVGNASLETTNSTLSANGFTPLSDNVEDENGNNVRYLCDSGLRALAWNENTSKSVSKAGSKRTYYLRAVKRVTVKLANNQ